MSDPPRLLDGPPGTLERDLLQLWRDDLPPENGKANVMSALVGAGYLLPGAVSTVAASSAAAPTMTAATNSAVAKSFLSSLGWTKWFIGGGLLGTVTISQIPTKTNPAARTDTPAALVSTSPPRQVSAIHTPAEQSATSNDDLPRIVPDRPGPAPTVVATVQVPGPKFELERPVVSESAPAVPSAASDLPLPALPKAAAPRGSALSEQIVLLDRTRAASDAGRQLEALQLLDTYERQFTGGVMEQEALLLKVEVLLRKGDRPAAEATARRFLDLYPRSSHVRRLQSLLTPLR